MTSSKTQPEISHGFKKRFLVDEECYEAEGFRNSTFKRAIVKVPKRLSVQIYVHIIWYGQYHIMICNILYVTYFI